MSDRIRWYNRLAAWLYGVIADPLRDLAVPVWAAEAEEDADAQWEAEQKAAVLDEPICHDCGCSWSECEQYGCQADDLEVYGWEDDEGVYDVGF